MGKINDLSPDESLEILKKGNLRFSDDMAIHPNSNCSRRIETAEVQKPFAAIITCSDSRVPPEIIFDCGIGDIFVLRNAGNIADRTTTAGIIYAVEHLGARLIVILGHESCGAIKASIMKKESILEEPAELAEYILNIRKNIPLSLKFDDKNDDKIFSAVKENVCNVSVVIQSIPLISSGLLTGKLAVKKAYYSFKSGIVEFF